MRAEAFITPLITQRVRETSFKILILSTLQKVKNIKIVTLSPITIEVEMYCNSAYSFFGSAKNDVENDFSDYNYPFVHF